jgi:serine/threonine-protein kinase
MNGQLPDSHGATRDERLAALLAELTQQLQGGPPPDLAPILRQHPDLADELGPLWAAVLVAEELGRGQRSDKVTLTPASGEPPRDVRTGAGSLPRPFGDYELLEECGRGGMGIVYKARQRSLKRTVAVKMILRGDFASEGDLTRFRVEAEAAGRLDHPNIVRIYEVGQWQGQAYFSMQYIEGTTLARLSAQGPLPPREAAGYLEPICRAVHHAHEHGILHRDLKPSNVLLDRQGQPHVSDFGLAKRVDGGASLTRTGAVLGTPSYMAPEQAAGSRGVVRPATDVYSLGSILYELITGRPPFQAATAMDTILLVLEQEPVPPRLLNKKVDRDLEMICLKCLQKPPDLRYTTAAELADDLAAFVKGERIAARSSGLLYHVGRLFSETHHATVLENWGLLWMWHSLVLITLCALTNCLYLAHVRDYGYYLALWGLGFGTWALVFWVLRRRGGPVTFVERQIAHVWAASTLGSMSLFVIERLLGLEVLTLSPVLAVLGAGVFLVKAGMLSGAFYIAAAANFGTALLMALFPDIALFLFGVINAACFFLPGLKYHRQRRRGDGSVNEPASEGEPAP